MFKENNESKYNIIKDYALIDEGDENEIVQEVEAGNISLNLPLTQFVNVGSGKSEGLFGIKMINRFKSPREQKQILDQLRFMEDGVDNLFEKILH